MIIDNVAPSAAVKVIFDTATEIHPGLCPVLSPRVGSLISGATAGQVPSERAVRIAIDSTVAEVPEISGFNYVSTNELSGNVFQESIIHNELYFKSLKFTGPMYPMEMANRPGIIYLASTQLGPPSGVISIVDKTLNGGINQCVNEVTWEALSGLTGAFTTDDPPVPVGIPIFRDYEGRGKVIGKILIKCNEPFSFSDKRNLDALSRGDSDCVLTGGIQSLLNYVCIGTDETIQRSVSAGFTQPFALPGRANNLTEFSYGELMLDKVEYLNEDYRYGKESLIYDRMVTKGDWTLNDVTPLTFIPNNSPLMGFKLTGATSTAESEFAEVPIISGSDVNVSGGLGYPMGIENHGLYCNFQIYPTANTTNLECALYDSATEVFKMRKNGPDCEYWYDDASGNQSWVQLASGADVFTANEFNNIELYNFATVSGYSFDIKVNGDYIGNCISCAPTGTASTSEKLDNIKFGGATPTIYLHSVEMFDRKSEYKMSAEQLIEYRAIPAILVDDEIKLYKLTPYQDSVGSMTVIIFYDDFRIERERGDKIFYLGGTGNKYDSYLSDYEIYNYETGIDARIRGTAHSVRANYGAGYNEQVQLMYSMGGCRGWDSDAQTYLVNSTVERMDIVNYTPRVLPANMIPKAYRFSMASTYTDAYAFGGYTEYAPVSSVGYGTDIIQKFNYATEVMYDTGIVLDKRLSDSAAVTVWPVNQEIYILGGRNTAGVSGWIENGNFENTIRKFNASTDTLTIEAQRLLEAKEGTMCVYDGKSKIYIAGGAYGKEDLLQINGGSRVIVNTINTFDIVNDTVSAINAVLTTPKAFGAGNTNNARSIGYFAGGGNNTPSTALYFSSSDIDIVNFITDTDCVKCKSGMARKRVGIQGVTI